MKGGDVMNYEDMGKLDFYEMVEQRNLDTCRAAWFAFKIIFGVAVLINLFS